MAHRPDDQPTRRRSDRHQAPLEPRNQPTHLRWIPEEDIYGRPIGHITVYQERNPHHHRVRYLLTELCATLWARVLVLARW